MVDENLETEDLDEVAEAAFDSPFRALLDYLRLQFPLQMSGSVVRSLDSFQKLDGNLVEAVYQSSIFHLARRLVNLAKYAVRTSVVSSDAEVIRAAVDQVFDVSMMEDPNRLYLLVFECHRASRFALSDGKRKAVIRASRKSGSYCYICGETLSFENCRAANFCDAEHILPRSLGGGNELVNLKGACKTCNEFKKDRIGGADLGYETMVYPFKVVAKDRLSNYHLFAARFFGDGTCGVCGKPAEEQGRLEVRSKEETDAWHLFNALLVCPECTLKLEL